LLRNRPPVSDDVRNIDEIAGADRYLFLVFKGRGCDCVDCCIVVVTIIVDSDDSSIGRVV